MYIRLLDTPLLTLLTAQRLKLLTGERTSALPIPCHGFLLSSLFSLPSSLFLLGKGTMLEENVIRTPTKALRTVKLLQQS